MRYRCGSLLIILGVLTASLALSGQQRVPVRPVPIEPVSAILDAFRTHKLVALGLPHGDERGPAFVASLVRDPGFARIVNDIVMEGASGRYQDVMDRYTRGEMVPDEVLRRVWDDTTQPQLMWTGQPSAIYRAVRAVNASLPREHQIRILLGDPPIDWDRVQTPADYMKWLEQRDSYPAELIRREVIAKQRRALVVYGGGHLQRRNQVANYRMDDPLAQTVVSLLEASGIGIFVVRNDSGLADDQMKSWPVPSLVLLRGTTLGAADEPPGQMPRMAFRDGRLQPISREQWVTIRLEDQMDAALYLGPSSAKTIEPLPPTICADKKYIEERLKRMALAGLPPFEMDRLRTFCGLQAPK